MKTTLILFSVLYCLCTAGCKKNTEGRPQVKPPLIVPSIAADIEAFPRQFSNLEFDWEYSAEKVVRSESRTHGVQYWGIGLPDDIPKPTADYTRSLIVGHFLSKLEGYGPSYGHASLENYTETVKFTLHFEPLELCEGFDEIWSYRLGVAPVYDGTAGKYLALEQQLVSQNGHILYPIPNGTGSQTWGWGVRECKRTDQGLLVDIISNHPEEFYSHRTEDPHEPFRIVSTQYLYRPGAARLEKVTTHTESMDGVGVGYYLHLQGW